MVFVMIAHSQSRSVDKLSEGKHHTCLVDQYKSVPDREHFVYFYLPLVQKLEVAQCNCMEYLDIKY